MESPRENNRQGCTTNPDKRTSANLLKIDAEQAIGIDPRME
jgi:hypothetical protein